jgi:phospholipid/cholesterol/gamma-HCH transport system permease protein
MAGNNHVSEVVDRIQTTCTRTYDVAALTLDAFRHTGEALRRQQLLFKQLYEVGNRSLLIVSVFGLFVGMILVLYAGNTLERFTQQRYVGLTGLAIIWEFGPVFTAFILAGRIGSAYAAEIGTMKVYDEVDALKALGVRPTAYLATPRLLSCLVMLPVLVCFADFWALLGGAGMAWFYVHVTPGQFFHLFFTNLKFHELARSMIKAFVFGGIIAITGCYHGFQTTGGAEGVGRRTTLSVVHSLLAILVADYFISKILLAL